MTDTKEMDAPVDYPSNKKRIVIMAALYLSVFLVTLVSLLNPPPSPPRSSQCIGTSNTNHLYQQDQNIISTAIPRITDEFHSIADVGWYGSAYLLTTCSFQLLFGKIYRIYPAKPVFLLEILLFEIGSAICGAAPSSTAFIVGRAIAGLGASGLFSGLMVMMVYTVPLQQRPIYQGLFAAIFAIGSVIGPLLGGVFVDRVTWRWCFYINLPIGAVTILVVMLILHLPNQKLEQRADGLLGKLMQLDPIGNLAFFPGIICLILALQWGGTTYAWSSARIIVLLVLAALLIIAFAAIQVWKKDAGTVPPRIVKMRSIAASIWFAFFNGAAMMVMIYYLPIWFQAVKGFSAFDSGLALLPLVLSTVFGTISAGICVSKLGYYTPFFLLSSVVAPIGAGLISTFDLDTSSARWIGYQIIFGLGLGFGTQQAVVVVQTVLPRQDVATGSAIIFTVRFLGSAIFLPVGQNIFVKQLVERLQNLSSGIDSETIVNTGATALRGLASGGDLDNLLSDYNLALRSVFYMIIVLSSVTIIGSVLVEWTNLKKVAEEQNERDKAVRASMISTIDKDAKDTEDTVSEKSEKTGVNV